MPVFAEGRVEHQKLNQTTALLLFGWVFGVQLDYSCRLKSVSANAEKRVNQTINFSSWLWGSHNPTSIKPILPVFRGDTTWTVREAYNDYRDGSRDLRRTVQTSKAPPGRTLKSFWCGGDIKRFWCGGQFGSKIVGKRFLELGTVCWLDLVSNRLWLGRV